MILSDGVLVKSPTNLWQGATDTWPGFRSSWGATPYYASYSEMYVRQLWVATVVTKLAKGTARLPLKVYERDDLNRPERPDHPYAHLLRRPNNRHDRFFFWSWLVSTFDVFGEAFLVKIRDSGGRPVALAPLHPTAMHEEDEKDGEVVWSFQNGRLRIDGIRQSDLVHPRTYNPDSITRGLSPLEHLRRTLEFEDAAQRAQSSFWRRGARPGVVLKHKANLSQGAADRLKLQWHEIAGGADNTGATVVLEEGMEPESLTISANEAQYIESRKLNREEVCAVYDVPPPAVHILDRATFCLPADALVTTERGPVPIVDVGATDRVWSLVDGELRTQRVLWAGQTGRKPLLTLRTQNRTLRCTDNHPVMVRRAVQRNETPYPTARRYRWEHAWVPAGEVQVGDVIVTLAELPDHGGDACPTRTVSEGFAEFCGLLLGDGCVFPSAVMIARAGTALYMDHYRSVIRDEFAQRDGAVRLQEQARMTRFSSVSAARELVALGLGGRAHTKRVPEWVFELSPKLRAGFLRGFLDADGSVDKKGRISYSSVNQTMLRQIRELCIGLGVPVTNMRNQVGTTTLPNGRRCAFSAWTFTCSDPGANHTISSHDPRYLERLDAGVPFGTGGISTYYAYADRSGRVKLAPPPGCGHAKIVSITTAEETVAVYDIEVEGSHNFIAEGVVVHNSNITEQLRSLYRDTHAPRLKLFESVLESQLRGSVRQGATEPDFGDDVYAEFLMDEVLRGDFEARANAYAAADYMTMAEKRKSENLPHIDGTDRLFVNAATVPLDSVLSNPAVAEGLRTLMGRLSRIKELSDVDVDVLVAGLEDAGPAVRAAHDQAVAAGVSVPEFRERLRAIAGGTR